MDCHQQKNAVHEFHRFALRVFFSPLEVRKVLRIRSPCWATPLPTRQHAGATIGLCGLPSSGLFRASRVRVLSQAKRKRKRSRKDAAHKKTRGEEKRVGKICTSAGRSLRGGPTGTPGLLTRARAPVPTPRRQGPSRRVRGKRGSRVERPAVFPRLLRARTGWWG